MTILQLVHDYHKRSAHTWTVHHEYMGMTSYYRMYDPIKGQQLLYDLIEQILYGTEHTKSRLNPAAEIFKMPVKHNDKTSSTKDTKTTQNTKPADHKSEWIIVR